MGPTVCSQGCVLTIGLMFVSQGLVPRVSPKVVSLVLIFVMELSLQEISKSHYLNSDKVRQIKLRKQICFLSF